MSFQSFRGRPPANCHLCRERRVKCDRQRPACSQCSLKGLPCPGYRPAISVNFQDESIITARKVQKKKYKQLVFRRDAVISKDTVVNRPTPVQEKHPPTTDTLSLAVYFHCQNRGNGILTPGGTPSTPQSEASYDSQTIVSASPGQSFTLPKTLDTPAENLAIPYLLRSYLSWSVLDLISDFCETHPPDSPVFLAAHASGLAVLATEREDPRLRIMAREYYTIALTKTKAALSSNACLKDETLAATIYLGLFEAITFNERITPDAWTTHVLGALKLLMRRGRAQFQTLVGRNLYRVITADLRVSCIQREVPVPQEFRDFDLQAAPYFEKVQAGLNYQGLFDSFSDLRHMISTWDNKDPDPVINTARQLDSEIDKVCRSMGPSWEFSLLPKSEVPPGAWSGANKYPNLLVARHWNTMRIMRLVANGWVATYLGGLKASGISLSPSQASLFDTVRLKCEDMVTGILASVPQFVTPTPTKQARYLVMPLVAIGKQKEIPFAVREYARDQLLRIGLEARLPQALEAASMVTGYLTGVPQETEVWFVNPNMSGSGIFANSLI